MTHDLILALLGFAFVASMTPGPNNAMLMASGANFGFVRSLPHMLGITFGFCAMIALVGLGLMQIFDAIPLFEPVLTVVSVAYLLWLAWKIANAAPTLSTAPETASRPMSFFAAAAFQWINPKAWTMGVSAITNFATDADGSRSILAVWIVVGAFFIVSVPSTTTWTTLGQQMRRFLTSPTRLKRFNWIMAGLLVASVLPVAFKQLFGL